jgi:hypothetical protein
MAGIVITARVHIAMTMASIPTPAVMLTIPCMAPLAPIATMMVAHVITAAIIVENKQAISRIPKLFVPAAAKAYIIKSIAIVAVIIAFERAIGIAIIIAVALIIIAKARFIIAT